MFDQFVVVVHVLFRILNEVMAFPVLRLSFIELGENFIVRISFIWTRRRATFTLLDNEIDGLESGDFVLDNHRVFELVELLVGVGIGEYVG